MSEIVKIILTSSLTIIGGVLVFVAGQLVVKFVIEPIQELKKTLADIHDSLVFHARPILSSFGKEDWDNTAQDILRKLSCDLSSRIEAFLCTTDGNHYHTNSFLIRKKLVRHHGSSWPFQIRCMTKIVLKMAT